MADLRLVDLVAIGFNVAERDFVTCAPGALYACTRPIENELAPAAIKVRNTNARV
jgi:hypothetical protein